ncbi:hypothetical protein V2J09_002419, partial [Rumex salicifolius]
FLDRSLSDLIARSPNSSNLNPKFFLLLSITRSLLFFYSLDLIYPRSSSSSLNSRRSRTPLLASLPPSRVPGQRCLGFPSTSLTGAPDPRSLQRRLGLRDSTEQEFEETHILEQQIDVTFVGGAHA